MDNFRNRLSELTLIVFFITCVSANHPYRIIDCYSCIGARSMAECKTVTTCKINQVCYLETIEKYKDQYLFYGGCAYDDDCRTTMHSALPHNETQGLPHFSGIRRCTSCCGHSLCNGHEACHHALPKAPTTKASATKSPTTSAPSTTTLPTVIIVTVPIIYAGTSCFACNGVSSLLECSETDVCLLDQQCFLQSFVDNNGLIRYNAGCTSNKACDSSGMTGKQDICTACCNSNFCNSNICNNEIHAYQSSLSGSPRPCLQCYDQSVDELGSCLNSVQCASSDSRCSVVVREENDLVTVDMDCEENLPCNSSRALPNQMCSQCCSTDNCNRQLDCRNEAITTPLSTVPPVPSIQTTSKYQHGVECEICQGSDCGLIHDATVQCPDNIAPFCINEITNDVNGDKHIRKRCGNVPECEAIWLDNSFKNNNCSSFDPSSIYSSSFECKFCCVTPNCNRNIVPDIGTLYSGLM